MLPETAPEVSIEWPELLEIPLERPLVLLLDAEDDALLENVT